MKTIPLTQGKVALVDDVDFERANKLCWHAHYNHQSKIWYAQSIHKNKVLHLHRFILNAPENLLVDHRNGDGLDDQRCNLRTCTKSQNCCNSKSRKGTSKYKGVSFHKRAGKWQVDICKNYKGYYVGLFNTESEAAQAYNQVAVKFHGSFARLNTL